MFLSGGVDEVFPPRAKNKAAVQLQLMAQLLDNSLVLLHGLIVELCGLIERGLEVLNLLIVQLRGLIECGFEVLNLPGETLQQVVTFAMIRRP